MNLNKSLIKKIDNIVNLSKEFDTNFNYIINLNTKLQEQNITDKIYILTKNYIYLRSEHGSLILLLDRVKDKINSESTDLNQDLINKLYDLSTFYSIVANVSELINNIDFQYKKIAIKYPKFINKKPITILLIVEKIDPNNKYIKIIEEIKNKNPENVYKIIEAKNNTKINCKNILDKNFDLDIQKLPSLYLINDDNISEIPIDTVIDTNALISLIN